VGTIQMCGQDFVYGQASLLDLYGIGVGIVRGKDDGTVRDVSSYDIYCTSYNRFATAIVETAMAH
jgi:hypothetical protein